MHETLCTVVDRGVLGHRGAGRCMYVHGKDECEVLWQMVPMRIDMLQGRLGERRLQGSVVMTWRSNSAGGLERYSVCMCGCML
jgi:hypothetical protein